MTAIYHITKDGWNAEDAYREMKRYDFEDSFFYHLKTPSVCLTRRAFAYGSAPVR